jgi:probable F420-dependent oxidoreductase
MDIKTPGVFALTDLMTAGQLTSFALNVEKHRYGSLWFPEGLGRDPFAVAAHILTVTKKLIVGTGIANVWKREPIAMMSAARSVAEMFPGRFILGIGISHGPMMAQLGYKYEKPVAFMRNYLARMKSAPYMAPPPKSEPPIMIAALMPRMLALTAAETQGTIPVHITPEQTARMRAALGPEKWICVQQVAILEADAAKARRAARSALTVYLSLPNYLRSFRDMGFGDPDFGDGGSDRLVDSLIAWGDADAIRKRVAAHYDAGATEVSVSLTRAEGSPAERSVPDEAALRALAPR